MLRALGRPLDFLANPEDRENWVKVWDVGYEVLTWHPDAAALPASLLELHAAGAVAHAEEMRSRLGSVPVEQYLPRGHRAGGTELRAVAVGVQPRRVRTQRAEVPRAAAPDRRPLRADQGAVARLRQLASMARRAVEQFGRPAARKQTLRSIRERMAEKASIHHRPRRRRCARGLGEAERLGARGQAG